jgi:hypothetical protein
MSVLATVFALTLSFSSVWASSMITCPPGQARLSHPQGGLYCAPLYQAFPQAPMDCYVCQQAYYQRQMQTAPWMMPQAQLPWGYNPYSPWWAQQGRMTYPNFSYPGMWQYPGVQAHHYPGGGGVFAAKPNVYVKNSGVKLASFRMTFDTSKGATFLATTPWLKEESWEGLVTTDAFRVENVRYDYLFYDARLPHTAMQFRAGWCVDRERLVEGMVQELRELRFSALALQDFKEHWNEKIPQEPVYCVYPQFNAQLDAALPVEITPQAPFLRVVFILVPHRQQERLPASVFPELPRHSHLPLRPVISEAGPLEYMEWGVAFMDHTLIK